MELVGVKFEPRHWEALASGLADSGSRVERLQLVEVPDLCLVHIYLFIYVCDSGSRVEKLQLVEFQDFYLYSIYIFKGPRPTSFGGAEQMLYNVNSMRGRQEVLHATQESVRD